MQTAFPFEKITGRLTMELVSSFVLWLNVCPRKSGVSDTMSPRTIIIGLMINYNQHCKLKFGDYVQTHKSHEKSTGTARIIGALALLQTVNEKGGAIFVASRLVGQ